MSPDELLDLVRIHGEERARDHEFALSGRDDERTSQRYVLFARIEAEVRRLHAEILPYDENTLLKVYQGLLDSGLDGHQARDAINQIQNQGILFRERPRA